MSYFEYIPSLANIIKALYGETILLCILFVLRIVGIDLYIKLLWFVNLIRLFMFNGLFKCKIILIYTDADDDGNSTQSICVSMDSSLQDKKIKCIALDNSEELLKWPMNGKLINSIIILLTDVVPLSSIKKKRVKVQNRLTQYVLNGGVLILGHDTLYRRTKNDILQKFCGVTLTRFKRYDKGVAYTKNVNTISERTSTNATLLDSLPENFLLHDRECVTGNWSKHIEYLYITDDKYQIPLVTRQEIGNGVIFWINSGDHTEKGPPPSIALPAVELITLLDRFNRYPKGECTLIDRKKSFLK